MRRAIARRMCESKQRVPHFYESVVVEMDAVVAALAEMNAARDPGDRVTVGVSPYDPVRGIITFRAR